MSLPDNVAEIREARLAQSLDAIAQAEALRDNPVLSAALERMADESVKALETVDVRDQFAMVDAVVGWRKANAIQQVIADLCDGRETVMAEIESLNKQAQSEQE